ncbi:UDP-N-acetylmuramoyl-L-alanyl-D-glutamate--2,6-diaminopimelate ligase [Clostridium sp. CCUG 7971]|uniref:UDP-N-acetylmuramoyl-L-alanyl-D-glutamate--2, 6-diaminopimelate ligase n=1 Tax=Clostridium sp. CCUG 7971 TaxID=2811414 RepID=UPI001ABBE293|nr:UDP-N-acetylmuramoyl-L-alanyl-D-glutamate--2,6-diaminopimelate ligase [Clostridium sp. CCUG 7971]MBO3445333.1 UDP-N-acetylmuramoyl-L-alanyl-D-glutamate--2,6-diaminopimelate ligase [Clostridium sp. CCUG 7971]
MELYKLIKNLDVLELKGNIEIDISSIYYDSRKTTENSLFVCIKGFDNDGHKYVNKAIENGAKAFLIQEDVNIKESNNYTFIKVKDTRKSMAKIAANFYNNPTQKIEIIGVTGTNGKTSITTVLKEILNYKSNVGLIGTIKIEDGKNDIISNNTTPESIDLQKYFNNMVKNDCKFCAMEVSSHSLALHRVDEVDFNIGIFTNLTPEHLDFHKNLEEYRATKEKLFYKTNMANIINIDDSSGVIIKNNIKNLKVSVYTYGINNEADFMASNIKLYPHGVSYTLKTPTYTDEIYVNIPGKFTVYNTLGIIAACYILKVPIEIIKYKLKSIKGVEGRFESVKNSKGFNVIVDYAHTPDALENILISANEFVKGKVITVFGCGGDRDKTKRPLMGKIAQDNSDIAVITSDNPRTENPNSIIKDILSGIDKSNQNYITIENRREAIYKAIELADNNDLVIIAGKGHEDYQIIGKTKHHFNDKEVAKDAIESKNSSLYNI